MTCDLWSDDSFHLNERNKVNRKEKNKMWGQCMWSVKEVADKDFAKNGCFVFFLSVFFFFLAYVALLDSWERERERELIKMGDVVCIWFLILWYWLLSLRDCCWTCYVFCLIHDLILRTKFGLSLWDCTVEFETFTDTIAYIIIK